MNSPLYRLFIRLLILCVIAIIAIAADDLAVAYGIFWISLFEIFLCVVIIVMASRGWDFSSPRATGCPSIGSPSCWE